MVVAADMDSGSFAVAVAIVTSFPAANSGRPVAAAVVVAAAASPAFVGAFFVAVGTDSLESAFAAACLDLWPANTEELVRPGLPYRPYYSYWCSW